MIDVIVARALHVFAVVIWIGGVWMVTTVVLPAVRHHDLGDNALRAFEAAERRFVWHARTAVIVVGLTGVYMGVRLDMGEAFRNVQFWWLHLMVVVWVLFALILFVVEPIILKRRFDTWANREPDAALLWLRRGHWVLIVLSFLTIFGAVAGSQWWPGF